MYVQDNHSTGVHTSVLVHIFSCVFSGCRRFSRWRLLKSWRLLCWSMGRTSSTPWEQRWTDWRKSSRCVSLTWNGQICTKTFSVHFNVEFFFYFFIYAKQIWTQAWTFPLSLPWEWFVLDHVCLFTDIISMDNVSSRIWKLTLYCRCGFSTTEHTHSLSFWKVPPFSMFYFPSGEPSMMFHSVYHSEIVDLWKHVRNVINRYLYRLRNVNLFVFDW